MWDSLLLDWDLLLPLTPFYRGLETNIKCLSLCNSAPFYRYAFRSIHSSHVRVCQIAKYLCKSMLRALLEFFFLQICFVEFFTIKIMMFSHTLLQSVSYHQMGQRFRQFRTVVGRNRTSSRLAGQLQAGRKQVQFRFRPK